MREAVIVDAIRTPIGRRNGSLSGTHPAELAAHVLEALRTRNGFDPALVDDVIMGCVTQTGEQGVNIGRNAVLTAGWPESVPATTVDRQCGSSMQAAAFAAQGVIAGAYDIVVAGGIEHMTRVAMGVNMTQGPGFPFPEPMVERYSPTGLVPQGISAEMMAEHWKIGREELDQLAYDSHMRAHQATIEGRFAGEIVPITVTVDDETKELTTDEGIRPGTSLEKLASLAPAFQAGGVITAGNSSQISDGAAAALIMGRDTAEAMGLRPRARFVAFALAGVDPVMMLEGPIPATAKVLAKAGLAIDDIDLFEVNEAFSSVIAAWLRETGVPWDKVNVNGGAMANGHPLGASGGKLLATLLNELERRGGTYGLQTMCEGGGMANATIIERL